MAPGADHDAVTTRGQDEHSDSWLPEMFRFRTPIKWKITIALAVMHLLTIYTFCAYSLWELKWLILWGLFQQEIYGIGVGAGAHRLWSHNSFKAKWQLRALLLWLYYLSGQNELVGWVRAHRQHHKYADTDYDPHSSTRGLFFSHCGWLMLHKDPEVQKRNDAMDMSDVTSDPVVQIGDRYVVLISIINRLIFILIPVYLWGEDLTKSILMSVVTHVVGYHRIWSINSFGHYTGYKPYNGSIKPTENRFLSALTLGEGWHNYHHVFPWDYKAAEHERTVLYNASALFIDFFEKIGWAYDLKTASPELIEKIKASRVNVSELPRDTDLTKIIGDKTR